MKKLLCTILLIQLCLTSCNSKKSDQRKLENLKSTKSIKKVETIKSPETEQNQSIGIDTLKIKKYAQLILENKVDPSDDDETFECINQLLKTNQKNLDFYFEVFRIIVEKSDGALSEAIGQYIMEFLKLRPDFFFDKYSEFKLEEQNKFVGFMAYEFYFVEPDYKTEAEAFFTEVKSNLKNKTELNYQHLNSIKELTLIETEKIINQ